MSLRSPTQHHIDWGPYNGVSNLPNINASPTQSAKLQVGDIATVVNGPQIDKWMCTDATLNAAVYTMFNTSSQRGEWGTVVYADASNGTAGGQRGDDNRPFDVVADAFAVMSNKDTLLTSGPINESVTITGGADGVVVSGRGRGTLIMGPVWTAPSGTSPLILTDTSAVVQNQTFVAVGNGASGIEATGTGAESLVVDGVSLIANGLSASATISGQQAVAFNNTSYINPVNIESVAGAYWNGIDPAPGGTLIEHAFGVGDDGSNHMFHTGEYGSLYPKGAPIVTAWDPVSFFSIDPLNVDDTGGTPQLIMHGSVKFDCKYITTGDFNFDGARFYGNVQILDGTNGGTYSMRRATFAQSLTIDDHSTATAIDAKNASVVGNINIGDNVTLNLQRAQYDVNGIFCTGSGTFIASQFAGANVGTGASVTVTFPNGGQMAGTSYAVSIQLTSGAFVVSSITKTTTDFTVNFTVTVGGTFDWQVQEI